MDFVAARIRALTQYGLASGLLLLGLPDKDCRPVFQKYAPYWCTSDEEMVWAGAL
jgi:hypothetical protein